MEQLIALGCVFVLRTKQGQGGRSNCIILSFGGLIQVEVELLELPPLPVVRFKPLVLRQSIYNLVVEIVSCGRQIGNRRSNLEVNLMFTNPVVVGKELDPSFY